MYIYIFLKSYVSSKLKLNSELTSGSKTAGTYGMTLYVPHVCNIYVYIHILC